jgi:hypothetical protein
MPTVTSTDLPLREGGVVPSPLDGVDDLDVTALLADAG